MISYAKIQRIASQKGVSEKTIEKDYFIELILFFLAREKYFQDILVFRGGTALKKIYFPDYRFSEDLDFLAADKEGLTKCAETLNGILVKIGAEYPIQLGKRSDYKKDRLQVFIIYNLIPEIRGNKELKVDILKDNFLPAFEKKGILFQYDEFKERKLELNSYILESVASDKISRILDVDNEPRDVYDLLHILRSDIDSFKIKRELKKRFGYEAYLPNLLNEIGKEAYRKSWEIRLSHQIVDLPNYEIVVKELRELIRLKLLNNGEE
jgi:uncharacterized protein